MSPEKINSSRELAKLAGVSHMTVCRAFRKDGWVKEETRAHIFELAKEHGYSPNPLVSLAMQARNQNQSRTIGGTLGWIHSNINEDSWRKQPHLIPLLKGVRDHAKEMGFGVDEFWMGPGGSTAAQLNRILPARGIRGLIIAPPPGVVKHMSLNWNAFATATFDHDTWRPLLNRVAVDELHKVSTVLREITKRGYTRPALAIPAGYNSARNLALSGRFLAWQQDQPAKLRIPPLLYPKHEIKLVKDSAIKWLQKYRPDCLLCSDIGALAVVGEAGIKVHEEMGLVHLQIGSDVADWSGYRVDQSMLGSFTVDLVVQQLVRNQTGIPETPREVLLRGEWQEGKTTINIKHPKTTA